MKPHQSRFLDLALERNVLRFGEFSLKSGRTSPYFFNAGLFDSGAALATLGECYADALEQSGLAFDMLFGPAYKGIPLATTLAVAMARRGRDLPVAFNRKEAKAHGEGGLLIGAPVRGRVLIVDDVITAGTAIRESIQTIRDAGGEPCGVLIALDRQERGQAGARSAAQEVSAEFGLPVHAIAGLDNLLAHADERPGLAAHKAALVAYRSRYGSHTDSLEASDDP
ncbi:MAG: orotate phosphoribosyltransferase [Arenimonas sp.]|uniref:orotate phosphoribosyltransferase n=1 Tax=Arenimonas sp. TaxID=1872635 RepID=UPI0025C5F27F|nr:orotate phosphoribosyltransferase [Arenimonas sp.]MBW8367942.1 orotate phosphoribosyltransferase [Arenimonas sp.]